MTTLKNSNKRGFSLAELVISIGLGIFVLTTLFYALSYLFKSTTHFTMKMKVDSKLNTIAEMTRREAAYNFASMTQVDEDYTTPLDPRIRITRNITDVDPVTKTRRCTLVAKVNVGQGATMYVYTATKTFEFANSYASGSGAAIFIKVVQEGTNIGVAGVRVTLPGAGTPYVVATTSVDGVTVYGVAESSQNIRADLDSYNTRAYFPENPPTFQKSVYPINPLEETRAGAQPVLFANVPVRMPGVVRGRVLDAGDTVLPINGVAQATVRLFPTTVPPTNTGTPMDPNPVDALTDSNGNFVFPRVIEGYYYITVAEGHAGGDEWATTDVPGSFPLSARRATSPVHPGMVTVPSSATIVTPDLYTIRRGELRGTTRVLQASGGSWGGPAFSFATSPNMPFTLFFERDKTYTDNSILPPLPPGVFHWQAVYGGHDKSMYADFYFSANGSQYGNDNITSDASANYIAADNMPLIVHRDHTGNYPMTNQNTFVLPYTSGMPNGTNASPVFVRIKNSEPEFYVRSNTWSEMVMPVALAPTISRDDFFLPVYTNKNIRFENQNVNINTLERNNNTFANLQVQIRTNGYPASYFNPAECVVETRYAIQGSTTMVGSGALSYQGGQWVIDSDFEQGYQSVVDTPQGALFTYNFQDTAFSPAQNRLIPNLNTDQQRFSARFVQASPFMINSTFFGPVLGYSKSLSGGVTTYAPLLASNVDITNVLVQGFNLAGHRFSSTTDIVDGQLLMIQQVQAVDIKRAEIPPHHYNPGETWNAPNGIAGEIIEIPPNIMPELRTYFVNMDTTTNSTDGWATTISAWFADGRPFDGSVIPVNQIVHRPRSNTDPLYTPTFTHRGQIRVSGHVYDLENAGAPFPSVQMNISGTGLPGQNTTTDLQGFYTFNSGNYMWVTLASGNNFIVTATPGGTYLSRFVAQEAYEPSFNTPMPDVIIDFYLNRSQGGQGTGGSG